MGEINVKLGADNSEFRSGMSEAGEIAGKTFGTIEHHMLGTRAIATAVGTALGLHIQGVAESVARFVTGMSKEVEESLKEMEKMAQETADRNIQMGQESMSVQSQITLVLQQQNKAIEEKNKLENEIKARRAESLELSKAENLSLYEASRILEKGKQTQEEAHKLAVLAAEISKDAERLEKLRVQEKKEANDLEQEAQKNSLEYQKEQQKLLDDGIKVGAAVLDNLEKQRKETQDLIAAEVQRRLAAQGTLSEFEKQLAVIQQMQGSEKTGFKVGQDNTVSVGDLEKALNAAKAALEFAQQPNTVNRPEYGARALLEAQAAYDQAQRNYNVGRMASITSNNSTRVSTSLLDFAPTSTAADLALGTKESVATAQALATIGKHSANTTRLLQQIKQGLIPGGVSTGEDTATITGSGGTPDSTPLSGITGSLGGLI